MPASESAGELNGGEEQEEPTRDDVQEGHSEMGAETGIDARHLAGAFRQEGVTAIEGRHRALAQRVDASAEVGGVEASTDGRGHPDDDQQDHQGPGDPHQTRRHRFEATSRGASPASFPHMARPAALRIAALDPTLTAIVVDQRPLYYAEGADPALDRPAHVRAGSSLAWVPGGIALIQDDANFLAIVDPVSATVRSITLPAGEDGRRQFDKGRGNKQAKLDLEACVAVEVKGETILLAFGSGSTERRQQILTVRGWERPEPQVALVEADELYELLRREHGFAPSRLNIEGVAVVGEHLRFFSRGNGKPRGGIAPVNATCDIHLGALLDLLSGRPGSALPKIINIHQYDLGLLAGVPLSFTDATPWHQQVLFSAAAEASPDAVEDGLVTGSVIGMIDGAGRARWTPITDRSGADFGAKVEGVVPAKEKGHLYVVVDADDPEVASVLCTVELRGA